MSQLQDRFYESCCERFGLERGAKGEQIEYTPLNKELLVAESELEQVQTVEVAQAAAGCCSMRRGRRHGSRRARRTGSASAGKRRSGRASG